jgi:hypothetical protein
MHTAQLPWYVAQAGHVTGRGGGDDTPSGTKLQSPDTRSNKHDASAWHAAQSAAWSVHAGHTCPSGAGPSVAKVHTPVVRLNTHASLMHAVQLVPCVSHAGHVTTGSGCEAGATHPHALVDTLNTQLDESDWHALQFHPCDAHVGHGGSTTEVKTEPSLNNALGAHTPVVMSNKHQLASARHAAHSPGWEAHDNVSGHTDEELTIAVVQLI